MPAANAPAGHTPEGGVLVGGPEAAHRMVLYEDPQCPYCRMFEEGAGDLLSRAVQTGSLAVEYRMRCFLGPESVRADNALAGAAEQGGFDRLRRYLFAHQPPEQSGGYTEADLLDAGAAVGLGDGGYAEVVRSGRYVDWVLERERTFQAEDPEGTPAAVVDGARVSSAVLFEPSRLVRLLG